MEKFIFTLIVLALVSGCATETPPKYNPKNGTAHKTYSTGELGSHFVKDLLGIGDN